MQAKLRAWRAAVLMLAAVLSVKAVMPDGEVILANGDRVSGRIVEDGADAVVIETVYAGKITIARKHIKSVNANRTATAAAATPKPALPDTASKTPVAKPATVVARRPVGFSARVRTMATGWEGSANIGFSYTSGNSNNITMSTG